MPGTDTLRGTCHCGAERHAEDPVELWEWLLAHPQGHQGRRPCRRPDRRARLAMREDGGRATGVELVVAGRETGGRRTLAIRLRRPDGGDLPGWTPGAHIDLELGPGLVRQYSLCGDPADRSVLRVAVQREPDGRGGSRLAHERLTVGATVRVRGPRNTFPLVPARRYLFVAGGIGITPIAPMVAAADAAGARWRVGTTGDARRATMAFATTCGSGRRPGAPASAGRDRAARPGRVAGPARRRPRLLLRPGTTDRRGGGGCAGWPPGRLHVERFAAAGDTGAPETAIEVELALSGRTVTVPPGTPILQAVEEAGVPVLSSCREGTCGTCETPVLGGRARAPRQPAHRAGAGRRGHMMICVSRARTPRLVLEL